MSSKETCKVTTCWAEEKIQQEELSILNIYAQITRVPSFIKETLLKLKVHIAPNTLIVGDLTLHSHQWTDQENRN